MSRRYAAALAGRLAAVALALWAPGAAALTCTVSATSTSFGAYSPFDLVPLDAAGNVRVTCGNLVNILVGYTIFLSSGASGTVGARHMVNGAYQLAYNLYANASRSVVWGDGSAGSVGVSESYLLLLLSDSRNYPVYGRIPAGQNVPAGAYADSITVTVDY